MDSLSLNIFQQARLLVAQADREMAEVAARFDEAFPLSKEEKEALRPVPVDAFDRWSMEFAPAGAGATFLMTPGGEGAWVLDAVEEGKAPQKLGSFRAAPGGSAARSRLRAARVVLAIGDWMEKGAGKQQPVEMETVLVMEASARMEIKSESRPKAQPTPQPLVAPLKEPLTLQATAEEKPVPAIQPRWLEMLPGAQEMANTDLALAAAAASSEKEGRLQTMKIGKIFGF